MTFTCRTLKFENVTIDGSLPLKAVGRSPHELDENSNQFSFSHVQLIQVVRKLPKHFLRMDHVRVVEHLTFLNQEISHRTKQHSWESEF